ncbi:MAG: hypothetical protein HW397_209 [Dehalococcoidia bacterium]|nr:hypothetical protein [Dehalococcoidia bacterium]
MPLVPGPEPPFDALGDQVHGRRGRLCLSRLLPSSCLLAPVGAPPLPQRASPTRSEFPCPIRMPLSRAGALSPR